MGNSSLPPPDWSHDLRRGLFGYHTASVDQRIEQRRADEAAQIEQWSNTMNQMAIDLARLEERTASTEDMANYWRLECERMKRQLDMEKAMVRYAEEGVEVEIHRLEEEYEQRARVSQSVQSRHQIATKHYEEVLWRLSESLTRVLQEAQTLASRVLSSPTSDTVWQEIRTTLLGTDEYSLAPHSLIDDLVWQYPLPPKRVQALSRSGESLGYVESVIILAVPARVLAYVVSPRGAVLADHIQVIRNGSLIVGRSAPFVSTAEILAPFHPPMDDSPRVAPTTPDPLSNPPTRRAESLDTGAADHVNREVLQVRSRDRVEITGESTIDTPDSLSSTVGVVNNLEAPGETPQPEDSSERSVPRPPEGVEMSQGDMVPSWGYTHQPPLRQSDELSLRLPGVDSEDAPPTVSRAKNPQRGTAEFEPLPGVSAPPRSSLPSPSWTEKPSNSQRPSVGDDSADQRVTPVATPVPQEVEGASLDVRSFLHGKHVGQDIVDSQNNMIAQQGDLITPEVVQRVELAGRLPDLIVHMVFE